MKLAHKIVFAFTVIGFLMVLTGSINYLSLRKLTAASDQIEHVVLPDVHAVANMKYSLSSVRRLEAQIVIATSKERLSLSERLKKSRDESLLLISEAKKGAALYPKDISENYEKQLVDLDRIARQYFYFNEKVVELSVASPSGVVSPEAVKILFEDTRQPYYAMMKIVDDVGSIGNTFAKKQGIIVDEELYKTIVTMLVGVLVVTASAIYFAWSVIRQVIVPINHVSSIAEIIASGNLTAKIPAGGRDEIGKLMASISHMQKSLITLVQHVNIGSRSVANASSEIAQGNMDLSTRTENQASSLSEIVSRTNTLSSTVSENTCTADAAKMLADQTSSLAIKGGTSVDQVVQTMSSIEDSSKKIADIISVIDGIAFQTNILALNAAVEAARAGDHGKGFAVVALEVRNLAGRSAAAAKEIKTLIDESVSRVSSGVSLANGAGNTMADIVESIGNLSNLVSEISVASKAQQSGITDVGTLMQQIDAATQQNAALVEEMAAAASGLNNQANSLVAEVSQFKIA